MELSKKLAFAEIVFSDDSSDEECASLSPITRHQLINFEEEEYITTVMQEVVSAANREKHERVKNFVSRVVTRYLDIDFLMHFRFPRQTVEFLAHQFERTPRYQKILHAPGRDKISAMKHILAYLWFAGHQSVEFRDVADRFDITISSLSAIITRVNHFLISLSPTVIRFPRNARERSMIRDGFVQKTGTKLREIMGAIDGSHVMIDKPKEDPISYLNRKKYYSIQLQGLCDHRQKFMHITVGYPGSVHDARVFNESSIPGKLDDLCEVGSYILGDSAYPLRNDLMTPYKDNGHLSVQQHNFNSELSKARITIEHTFGQLKQRFRQLYFLKLRNVVRRVEFIHALCVLHNLGNKNDLQMLEPPEHEEDMNLLAVAEEIYLNEADISAENLRNTLCNDVARRTPAHVMQTRANNAALRRL